MSEKFLGAPAPSTTGPGDPDLDDVPSAMDLANNYGGWEKLQVRAGLDRAGRGGTGRGGAGASEVQEMHEIEDGGWSAVSRVHLRAIHTACRACCGQ